MSKHDSEYIVRDSQGTQVDLNDLTVKCMADTQRILANDEISAVIYVGDLDLHVVTGVSHPVTGEPPPDPRGYCGKNVQEITLLRFPPLSMRRQIGAVMKSVLESTVFIVKDGEGLRKVKARDLKPGMILKSGEKVLI
jgi:hypothetical protein